MRNATQNPVYDLEREMIARAQDAWDAMSDDVCFAMQRRLFQMNAINAIKAVGAYHKDGAWSITPFPGAAGFGELGLTGCKFIYDKLSAQGT